LAPSAITVVPEPVIVPRVHSNCVATTKSPTPATVPAFSVKKAVLDSAEIERTPPQLTTRLSLQSRLLMAWLLERFTVSSADALMMTSSSRAGNSSPLQFSSLSQFDSSPPPSQKTATWVAATAFAAPPSSSVVVRAISYWPHSVGVNVNVASVPVA